MNLAKLLETQKQLMERIEENHQAQSGENRFYKRLLALLVEVGECANEWRGFKFWSNDQTPRNVCTLCKNKEFVEMSDDFPVTCWECDGEGKNPLLEEYVDGFHFVLEIVIVLERKLNLNEIRAYKSNSIEQQFIKLYREITNLWLESFMLNY